jgi:diketogulonate reductase-like aldo/keto reductase
MMRTVTLPDGTDVAALGQGTWKIGEGHYPAGQEAAAIRLGIELGLTLIDTAEMYGDGASERVVGEAVAGLRDRVFLVTKVYPHNASRNGVPAACARSLKRLATEAIDLYLLHWRGGIPLAETVAAFEKLKAEGRIRRWGVSNFDADDMAALLSVPGGENCAVNQVLYNPEYRGIEFDLLAWQAAHRIPVMAYSPVGQGGRLLRHPALKAVAARHGVTPAQVAIAWSLRHPNVISIPKAGAAAHVRENAAAGALVLTPEDLAEIDRAYKPPVHRQSLAML